MKRFAQFFLSAIPALIFSYSTNAQTTVGPKTEYEWAMAPRNDNSLAFAGILDTRNYRKDVLYLSSSEAVIPVRVVKKDDALVKISDKALEKWRLPVVGRILGFATLGNNILLISTPDVSNKENWADQKTIHAALVNPSSGKIVTEKDLFQFPGSFVQITVNKAANGTFQNLQLQYTIDKKALSKDLKDESMRTAEKIEIYKLDDNLKPLPSNQIINKQVDKILLRTSTTEEGNLFAAWYVPGKVILEVYKESSSTPLISISSPHELKEDRGSGSLFSVDPKGTQAYLFLSSKSKKEDLTTTFYFDLQKKTASANIVSLNSDSRKTVEQSMLPGDEEKEFIKGFYSDLRPADAFWYGDKLVLISLVRQVIFPASSGDSYSVVSGQYLIAIHDHSTQPAKLFFNGNGNRNFVGVGASVGFSLQGDKLRMMNPRQPGRTGFYLQYGEIDLKQQKWTQLTEVTDGKSPYHEINELIEPGATLWFPNSVVVQLITKPLTKNQLLTRLQQLSYPSSR